mmetsp:Transcript_60766/g.170268  ORF Transcript_60766/g.170268 Transcript_60766/m.170268 type:complete len:217 (-) Transcript_60766:69-719(-)
MAEEHFGDLCDAGGDGLALGAHLQRAALEHLRRRARDPSDPGLNELVLQGLDAADATAERWLRHEIFEQQPDRGSGAQVEKRQPVDDVGLARERKRELGRRKLGCAAISWAQRQRAELHQAVLRGRDPRHGDAVDGRAAPSPCMQPEAQRGFVAAPHLDALRVGRRGVDARQLRQHRGHGAEVATEADVHGSVLADGPLGPGAELDDAARRRHGRA